MKKSSSSHKISALDIFYRVLSFCSLPCLFKLAKYLAFFISHIPNQLSTITAKNIRLCFPELTRSEQKKVVIESIQHTNCSFFELAKLWNAPINIALSYITSKQIDNKFYQIDKPKIVIAPHHGSWELLNLWLADSGITYSLYKPARTKSIDKFVLTKRTKNGAILVPANTSGLRKLLQGLRNNACCMILPDQRPASNTAQINANFYHHSARTSLLIKKLASKVDCNIFIASVTRDLISNEYKLTVQSLERCDLLQDDLKSATYLNKSIEDFIKSNLSQYQWAYRRFNHKEYNSIKL